VLYPGHCHRDRAPGFAGHTHADPAACGRYPDPSAPAEYGHTAADCNCTAHRNRTAGLAGRAHRDTGADANSVYAADTSAGHGDDHRYLDPHTRRRALDDKSAAHSDCDRHRRACHCNAHCHSGACDGHKNRYSGACDGHENRHSGACDSHENCDSGATGHSGCNQNALGGVISIGEVHHTDLTSAAHWIQ
jgi:hypothetical protein